MDGTHRLRGGHRILGRVQLVAAHTKGFADGKTCIDCHKGIAHTLPAIEQNIGAPKNVESGEAAQPAPEKAAAK